jgi:glycosyltransferase involved in cell wall biosynthesis
MAPNQVAIIIPAFNEAGSIGNVIEELVTVVGTVVPIIVVDDCSNDGTAEKATSAGAYVVNLSKNHGYAQAINCGLAYASKELNVNYLLTMDADGQHDPYSVQLLMNATLENDVDLIVGKRDENARLAEWAYGKYFFKKFKVSDPLCGLKVYRTSLYQDCGTFETYDSIGTELLTWALLKKHSILQLPVNIRQRQDEPRFGSTWLANKRIFLSLIKTICYIRENSRK